MTTNNAALREFASHWRNGTKPNAIIQGVHGRLCRGLPGAPLALSDDKDRRVVFTTDSNGCHELLGLPGYPQLITIGWDPDYIEKKIKGGYWTRFVAFPASTSAMATWDAVLDAVERVYPEIAKKIARHRSTLRGWTMNTFKDMEARLGYRLLDIDEGKFIKASTGNDKADPRDDARFMTIARYQAAPDTVENARAFLYHTTHLKDLFWGDGYTRTKSGQVGVKEYIVPDVPLDHTFGEFEVFDVSVTLPKTSGGARKATAGEHDVPTWVDLGNARHWSFNPCLERRSPSSPAGVKDHADAYRAARKVAPSAKDRIKTHLLLIDVQKDFCFPEGTLYVAGKSGDGAIQDSARTASLIYRNVDRITKITPTMDTHLTHQIFFASFWVDSKGVSLSANRTITTKQIRAGEVAPHPAMATWLCDGNYAWLQAQALYYCEQLEASGKYELFLWPPHCILGTEGHALVGIVAEAMAYHSYLRFSPFQPEVKGGNPLTENYSVMAPEVLGRHDGKGALAQRNTGFLGTLLAADVVIIAGQAGSHCVKSSIADILAEIQANDPALARKCYVVRDLMSAVEIPGVASFTKQMEDALANFQSHGMHVVTSDVPMAQWPGMPT